MNTQTIISTPYALPPAIVLSPLLLTETSSATSPVDSGDLALEQLNLRATQVTLVLKDILEYKGYLHGGIND